MTENKLIITINWFTDKYWYEILLGIGVMVLLWLIIFVIQEEKNEDN